MTYDPTQLFTDAPPELVAGIVGAVALLLVTVWVWSGRSWRAAVARARYEVIARRHHGTVTVLLVRIARRGADEERISAVRMAALPAVDTVALRREVAHAQDVAAALNARLDELLHAGP